MNFIAPEFLYALGFLAIPILIHLFNFRRYKTVKFSQVRFLKNVKKQTQSTSRLKHIIVLLCRSLALASLVIAFAQPYLRDTNNVQLKGKSGVVIYLDNSFSMQANAEAGSLLDIAKSKVLAILDAYEETDRFQLHTNEFRGNQTRWLNKSALTNELLKVDFSPIFRSYDQVISRINELKNEEDYLIKKYIVSDLQQINFDFNAINTDSSSYSVIPVQSEPLFNAWLATVSSLQPFHLPGLSEQLNLTVKRSLNKEEKSYKVSLLLNDKLKSPFVVQLENDSLLKEVKYNNPEDKSVKGSIIIKDYPVTFDDTFYFSYPMQQQINVLHLFEGAGSKSIASLFEKDSLINYYRSSVQQVDFSALKKSSFIILDNLTSVSSGLSSELVAHVNNGGSLAVFPSAQMNEAEINLMLQKLNLGVYNKLINDSADVTQINGNAQVFKNVFEETPKNLNLPRAFSYWKVSLNQRSVNEPILTLRNGSSFLRRFTVNSGSVYLSAVALSEDQSNFSKHALFVPILFNMALQSVNAQELAYMLGERSVTIKGVAQKESPVVLKRENREFIPKQVYRQNSVELIFGNEITKAGHYQLFQGEDYLQDISFNFNRKESNLKTCQVEDFVSKAETLGLNVEIVEGDAEFLSEKIKMNSEGKRLWKYFIGLALLFIGLEILFLRILKG